MVVSLSLTGSGTLGDIVSWSVEEAATPAAPGDASGSVGVVNVDAEQGENTEFVIDNGSVFADDQLGSISGSVDSLVTRGSDSSSVSLTTTTPLAALNADRTAGPLMPGATILYTEGADIGPPGGIEDYRLYNGSVTAGPDGSSYWVYQWWDGGPSPTSAVEKRDRTGNILAEYEVSGSEFMNVLVGPSVYDYVNDVVIYGGDNDEVYVFQGDLSSYSTFGSSGSGAGQFNGIVGVASDSSGRIFVAESGNNRVQRFSSGGTYQATIAFSVTISGKSGLAITGSDVMFVLDGPGNVYKSTLGGTASQYTAAQKSGSVAAVVGIELSTYGDYLYALYYTNGTGDYVGRPYASQYDTTTDSWVRDHVMDLYKLDVLDNEMRVSFGAESGWIRVRSSINANQKFAAESYGVAEAFQFCTSLIDPNLIITYQATPTGGALAPGWTGNVWTYIKKLCVAYGVEITPNLVVRDIASTDLDLTVDESIAGSVTLSLDSIATGRSVQIENYNTTSGTGTIFDAYDTQQILSVSPGETSVVTIQTDSYATYVNQPYFYE